MPLNLQQYQRIVGAAEISEIVTTKSSATVRFVDGSLPDTAVPLSWAEFKGLEGHYLEDAIGTQFWIATADFLDQYVLFVPEPDEPDVDPPIVLSTPDTAVIGTRIGSLGNSGFR